MEMLPVQVVIAGQARVSLNGCGSGLARMMAVDSRSARSRAYECDALRYKCAEVPCLPLYRAAGVGYVLALSRRGVAVGARRLDSAGGWALATGELRDAWRGPAFEWSDRNRLRQPIIKVPTPRRHLA